MAVSFAKKDVYLAGIQADGQVLFSVAIEVSYSDSARNCDVPSTVKLTFDAGARTWKNRPFDRPPPGLTTVTDAVEALATSAAVTVARSSLDEMKVVLRGEPFQFTAAPAANWLPWTVNAKAL